MTVCSGAGRRPRCILPNHPARAKGHAPSHPRHAPIYQPRRDVSRCGLPIAGQHYERSRPQRRRAYDLLVENGRVVDGTGAVWFLGDVAIRGDRIAGVTQRGVLHNVAAGQRIDASGLVVAPGFIDIQGQSGGLFLAGDGRDVGKISQGGTTEILGEGATPAPLTPARIVESVRAGGTIDSALERRFADPHGFDNWLRAMLTHGISPNVGSFVGVGTIRVYGMGLAVGQAKAALDSMR